VEVENGDARAYEGGYSDWFERSTARKSQAAAGV